MSGSDFGRRHANQAPPPPQSEATTIAMLLKINLNPSKVSLLSLSRGCFSFGALQLYPLDVAVRWTEKRACGRKFLLIHLQNFQLSTANAYKFSDQSSPAHPTWSDSTLGPTSHLISFPPCNPMENFKCALE